MVQSVDNINNTINQIPDPATREACAAMFAYIQTAFNEHTHNADGAQTGAYQTSTPRSDAETVSAGTVLQL